MPATAEVIAAATTVPEYLRALRDCYGPRVAVVGDRNRITYDELFDQSAMLARHLLARGVGKGARVGVLFGNGPDWVLAWAALARIGAVPVAMSTFARASELARVARHADLHGIIAHTRFLGDDVLTRFEQAFPSLAGQQTTPFAINDAPWLRWIAAVGSSERAGHRWASPLAWPPTETDPDPFDAQHLADVEAQVHPNDPAIMIYTSGSTADPKGVPHTNDTILRKTRDLTAMFALDPDVRSYTAAPFFWVGGLTMSLFPVLSVGGTQYCTDRFDAGQVLRLVASERLDRLMLYPHQIDAMLSHPDFASSDRSSLREADPRLLPSGTRPRARADGLRIGLGMTETFGGYWWGIPDPSANTPLRPGERRPPPLGRLQPGVELRVVRADGTPAADGERGEICIRGACITTGLHKSDRSLVFDNDGWFHTGDEGLRDGERVHFCGRLGDMIKTAGANVAPPEVAAVFLAQPGVAQCHVVGVPDETRGQLVVAAVVAAPGANLDGGELRAAAARELATYKVPARVFVLTEDEIPWTPSFKVAKAALAAQLAERL